MARKFEGDVQRFNEYFYRANPANYLQERLDQWMSAAEDAEAFSAVRVRSSGDVEVGEDTTVEPAVLSYLITDAVLLHHHAAETVVRYFLAHLDEHPAPWTEVARRRRGFEDFVRKHLIMTPPSAERAAAVVYGLEPPAPFRDAAQWDHALKGVVDFVVAMADTYIEGAPMYNSLKHGLGAASGRSDVMWVEELADPSRPTVEELKAGHHLGSGPRVEYPALDESDDGAVWSLNTEWVDVERSIRMIAVAIGLIRSIHSVGQRRRGVPPASEDSPESFFAPGPFTVAGMKSPGRPGAVKMSQAWLRETE